MGRWKSKPESSLPSVANPKILGLRPHGGELADPETWPASAIGVVAVASGLMYRHPCRTEHRADCSTLPLSGPYSGQSQGCPFSSWYENGISGSLQRRRAIDCLRRLHAGRMETRTICSRLGLDRLEGPDATPAASREGPHEGRTKDRYDRREDFSNRLWQRTPLLSKCASKLPCQPLRRRSRPDHAMPCQFRVFRLTRFGRTERYAHRGRCILGI